MTALAAVSLPYRAKTTSCLATYNRGADDKSVLGGCCGMRGGGLLLVLTMALAGCSGPPRRVAMSSPALTPPQAIVFSVDGAGNFQGLSDSFKELVSEDPLPLHVHTFEWSHGYRRIVADHTD